MKKDDLSELLGCISGTILKDLQSIGKKTSREDVKDLCLITAYNTGYLSGIVGAIILGEEDGDSDEGEAEVQGE